jgi:ATP-binding cassette subfamily C (CFTR/MRP) protein 4
VVHSLLVLSRYSILVGRMLTINHKRERLLAFRCLLVGKYLQGDMISSILRAPISFFDSTPSGRILNQFSKDMGVVDNQMAVILSDVIES